jgi:large subunit ribosomal protein L1
MAKIETQFKESLTNLRKEKERKFDQTVDLVINLQKFNVKKDSINLYINFPHKIKDKRIAGFLEVKNDAVDTITLAEFKKYNDKKALKKLVKQYDFFVAQSSLMPKVATTFGRALGPAGKMPSPQMGIMLNADAKTIATLKAKINTGVKIRTKESSIKLAVGKQSMKDEDIIENAMSVYNAVLKAVPRKIENIKNIELKFTMSKPQKILVR